MVEDVAALLAGYLVGSLSFSHWIARWRIGIDLRSTGIGNAGARNVWHLVGPACGLLAFLLDAGKGASAVLVARAFGASPLAGMLAGPAAILGHAFPIWCRFRGGIGLSTAVGILLVWIPLPALASLGIWLLAQLILRNLDRSLYLGAAAAIILPAVYGYRWVTGAYVLGLFLLLWALKLRGRTRQRAVWQASGWLETTHSDWYGVSETVREERSVSTDAADDA